MYNVNDKVKSIVKDVTSYIARLVFISAIVIFFLENSEASERAAKVDFLVGMWTDHIDDGFDYNESHKLLGIEYNGWAIARFKNSYNRTSVSLVKSMQICKGWKFGLGASTGYEDIQGYSKLTPIVMLSYNIGILDVNFMPDVGMGVGFRFKMEW